MTKPLKDLITWHVNQGVGDTHTALNNMPDGIDETSYLKGYHQAHMQMLKWIEKQFPGEKEDGEQKSES